MSEFGEFQVGDYVVYIGDGESVPCGYCLRVSVPELDGFLHIGKGWVGRVSTVDTASCFVTTRLFMDGFGWSIPKTDLRIVDRETPFVKPKDCACNIMVTGCTCGVMEEERRRKEQTSV